MMFRLQKRFEFDLKEKIIFEGTPNDLTYLVMIGLYVFLNRGPNGKTIYEINYRVNY